MVVSRRGVSGVKGKRIPGACDICKRKKIKCDSGERMGKPCTNCEAAGLDCTHKETTKALGPAKSYVANLEMRLEKMEKVLSKLLPGVDLNTDLDHLADMPDSHSSPSFDSSESPEPARTLCRHDDEDDYVDKDVIIKLQKLDLVTEPRFFGGSSGFRLIQTALDFKSQYIGQSAGDNKIANIFNPHRRDEFWTTFPWQRGKLDEELNLNASNLTFPDDDLFVSLVDLYFKEVNIFFPLLHRPTFERQITERLHLRDAMFGNVVLLVCGLGSKYSDDPRVLTEGSNTTRSSGHKWYTQVDTCRKSYGKKPSLYELQMIALVMLFGKSTGRPQGAWVHVGLGLKLAQEIGVHRRRRKEGPVTVEDELWTRAFWVLLAHDRVISATYGRPCTIYEEDYDLDYPIECDDEYWDLPDPSKSFQQPPDKPSIVSYFNCSLRLMEILGNVVRLLYTSRRPTSISGLGSEQEAVTAFDSALNQWIDCVPDHLRWSPDRKDIPFFGQSAALFTTYYTVQILIHRPFIPSLHNPSPIGFPSLAICTNAARSSCYIIDVLNQSNVSTLPFVQTMATTAALVLLVNIWNSKRSGVVHNCRRELNLVQKVLDMMSISEQLWSAAGRSRDIIAELASFSHVAACTSGIYPQDETLTSPSPSSSNGTAYPNAAMAYQPDYIMQPKSIPLNGVVSATIGSEPYPAQSNFTLPMYSNELGQIPVYGQFGSMGAPPNGQLPLGDLPDNSDRLYAPSANIFYGDTGSVSQASVSPEMNGFKQFNAQSSGDGLPQNERKMGAPEIWQMMGIDDVDMWLTSTNLLEWESLFMSVDQQQNAPANEYGGP